MNFNPNQAKLNGLAWPEDKFVGFFSWTVVIILGSDWFIMINSIVSNDYEYLLKLPFLFFSGKKIFLFFLILQLRKYIWCLSYLQEFFLKILIREWNFWQTFSVFLSPNIEILICQKNVWLSAINNPWYQNQYVTFWGQKALKFCYKSCLIIIIVESFFHMKFCVYVLRILVNNVILLCQNIAGILWLC